jgi:hypothetical protein
MEILALVVVWLVFCGVAAAIAGNKGRSGVGVFFLSVLLSPLVGLIVASTMAPNANGQGKKKCPDCAEFVQPDAKVCRFCQHSFIDEELEAARVQAEQWARTQTLAAEKEQARLAEQAKKPWLLRNLTPVIGVTVPVAVFAATGVFISLANPTQNETTTTTETRTRPAYASESVPVAHTFASAPGNGCVSETQEIPYIAEFESSAHKIAREKREAIQHECDKLNGVMHEELAKCKVLALENAPDPTVKSDCVRTENMLAASSEAVYRRLNASVKALNAVTKSEMSQRE